MLNFLKTKHKLEEILLQELERTLNLIKTK